MVIPFGLFGKTAFMAERVLGNVISSGIKVLVLAVIVGIGSTLFGEFTRGFGGRTPTIDDAMAIVLAALSLLGLGIFGPGIANGLVSGGPQLGAGAAIGTGLAAGGMVAAGGAAIGAVATGGAALAGGAAAAARGGAALAGGASTAWQVGAAGQSGMAGVASGLGNVVSAGGKAAVSPLKRAAGRAADSLRSSFQAGSRAVSGNATPDGDGGAASSAASSGGQPAWAKRMTRSQQLTHGVQAAAHAVRSGDAHDRERVSAASTGAEADHRSAGLGAASARSWAEAARTLLVAWTGEAVGSDRVRPADVGERARQSHPFRACGSRSDRRSRLAGVSGCRFGRRTVHFGLRKFVANTRRGNNRRRTCAKRSDREAAGEAVASRQIPQALLTHGRLSQRQVRRNAYRSGRT